MTDFDRSLRAIEGETRTKEQAALDLAVARIAAIAELGSQTLIMATGWPNEQTAYSLGAHRAFGQCAGMAREALADIAELRR